jgi:gamma-glutamylputrescine oxidase
MPPNTHQSYYQATAGAARSFPPLNDDLDADVCVIGGGFTGLSTALHAAQAGFKTCLLEGQSIGHGASGRNGGQVLSGQSIKQNVLERRLGRDTALQLWRLAEEAKALVKALVRDHAIACDLRQGHLLAAVKPGHARDLELYARLLRSSYGYDKAHFVPREDLPGYICSQRYAGGLYDSDAAHLHPLRFAYGLASAAQAAGAAIFENARVLKIVPGPGLSVETDRARIRARFAVLACDSYLGGLFPPIAAHTIAIHALVAATAPLGEMGKALIPGACAVADTANMLDYFRLSADGRLIFGGGESASPPDEGRIAAIVRARIRRVFPELRDSAIDFAWSGRIAFTASRLPHVGRIAGSLYFAQGYSGQGVAISTHMGRLIAEAIAGASPGFDMYASLSTPRFFMHRFAEPFLVRAALSCGHIQDRLLP